MLDRIGLVVSDLGRSKGFFEHALAPLGYTKLRECSHDRRLLSAAK
jgi:hypothetical protein